MTLQVFIDGAEGTTGLEIRERLMNRAEFSVIVLDDARRKDRNARRDALNSADIAILCLPDDAAREAVALIENAEARVIDASTAHRVHAEWTYGFPELIGRDVVARAKRVSNPGCYSTGFLALVAPLVQVGLLPADWPYTVNAVSGYSGGGKALIERFSAYPDMAFRAYGLSLAHKHLPEMQFHAGLVYTPVFSPSVTRAFRGMIVDVPLPIGAMDANVTAEQLREALSTFYKGSCIVRVAEEMPDELLLPTNAAPHDDIALFVGGDATGQQIRLVAHLDNLGKGASGAAVQTLNLMAELPEKTGLQLPNY